MGWLAKDLIPPSNVLFNRVAGAACVSFGAFIALTSVAGAVIGVLAWNGWLAIAYRPWDSAERKYQDYCFRASR